MKKLLLAAVIAALCCTSCSHSFRGTVLDRTFHSITAVAETGDTLHFTTIKAKEGAVPELFQSDLVQIRYRTLRSDGKAFRSVVSATVIEPCLNSQLAGKWMEENAVDSVGFDFVSGGIVNPVGIADPNYSRWKVEQPLGADPVLYLGTFVLDEKGVSLKETPYKVSLDKDTNILTIADFETGETVWTLKRQEAGKE